jgi:protein O-GlcNAc transferase
MASGSTWLQRILGKAPSSDELVRMADERRKAGNIFGARGLLERALAGDPDHLQALKKLGRIADQERRRQEAVDLFLRAVALAPDDLDAHHCLGVAFVNARRFADAEAAFRAGLARKGEDVDLLIGLANSLLKQHRLDEARAPLERAIALDPGPAAGEAWFGMASVALEEGRIEDTIAAFRHAHERMPGKADIHSGLLFVMNYSSRLSAAEVFAEHRRFDVRQTQPVAPPPLDRAWPRRLRIGYISPDFRSHVVACFVLPIIARHDRARFEVFCYYLHSDSDEVTEGLLELADHWRSCAGLSHREVASRIRDDRIDILVDLAGHTADNGMPVLAMRPAPLQMTYLGYPNTTGLRAVDYRVTDAKADPPADADALHSERLLRLPRTFLTYRPGPGLAIGPLPAEREGIVTFGSFNNILKWSEPFLALAARVLAAVPGSRLMLKERTLSQPGRMDEIRSRFKALGVDPARLVLRGWEPSPEGHLNAYSSVDIALDTFPYNGTTTTCEALWMGVPVVTLVGDRHAGRVGVSLLETVGLTQLMARTEEEYVRIAARLAGDLPALAGLREGMRGRMLASPLMAEAQFVGELERSFIAVWQERLRETEAAVLDDAALEAFWNRCHEQGDPAPAIDRIGVAIARSGESARRRYMLGCTLEDAGRLNEAAESYRKALELDPRHARAANNLGAVLQIAGDVQGAERSYELALGADPRLAVALANRARLRMLQERFSDAEADLRKALEIQPGEPQWEESLRECLRR